MDGTQQGLTGWLLGLHPVLAVVLISALPRIELRGGIPVSTTHTITGAIVGVGSTRRLSAVRWGLTIAVVWAWVLTIPGAALIAAAVRLLLGLGG